MDDEATLQCPSRLHGLLKDGLLEVKCRSKRCGASSAVAVFHYFNLDTGKLIRTKVYKDPAGRFAKKEEINNDNSSHTASVRSSAGDDLPVDR